MAVNFDAYNKVTEVVFEFAHNLSLKLNVIINETVKTKVGTTYQDTFHNEFILNGSNITTILKYKYNLSLVVKGEYNNKLTIDMDNYANFINAISDFTLDKASNIYTRKYSETGELIDIAFDAKYAYYRECEDRWGNTITITHTVLFDNFRNKPTEGLLFRIGTADIEVPFSRIESFNLLMKTYNPLLHAGAMARYMATTSRLGSNRKML